MAQVWLLVLALRSLAWSRLARRTGSARETLRQGNRLYGDNQYTEAVNKYNDALVEQPQAVEPKFNKANGYYRMDDLSEAMDLYQEVAADSKDMSLVAKAKYNLGNCFFQRGSKQRDSDLQKALDDMKTSITYWRQVLDIDPKNEKAARNIEVARLTIKDILDQIKKQQEEQKQAAEQAGSADSNSSRSREQQNQSQAVRRTRTSRRTRIRRKKAEPSPIPIRQAGAESREQGQQESSRSKGLRMPRPRKSSTRNSGRRKIARCCDREAVSAGRERLVA